MVSTTRCRAGRAWASRLAATLLLVPTVAVCVARPAVAQSTDSVTIAWRDAAGPVVGYDVYVSINDDAMIYHGRVSQPSVVLSGSTFQTGDALRVQVVGVAADGSQGPPSEISDVVYFPNVPTPVFTSVANGSVRTPTRLTWTAIPYVESYVVFRSEVPGELGSYVDLTDRAAVEDFDAELDVVYHYSVAAIHGRQVSEFSAQQVAKRGGTYPDVAASVGSLSFVVDPKEPTATQTIALRNTGDWELSFAAWPGAPWIQLSETFADIDSTPFDLDVTVQMGTLLPGVHHSLVRVFVYYEPPPGETFELGPPLEIPVTMTVAPFNDPPTIESPLAVTVAEGQVVEVGILATDPDPGDLLDVAMGQLPAFATFESLGGGAGRLTLAPGYETAGVYQPLLVAWDNAHYVVESFSITVDDTNRSPQAAMIPDTTISTGATSFVLVFAWDPDLGDRIALATTALSGFATFQDFGNGTGRFQFDPTEEDVGEYLIVVAVVDDGTPVGFTSVPWRLTVESAP